MSLRIMAKERPQSLEMGDKEDISRMLGTAHNGGGTRSWSMKAPQSVGGNLDAQLMWIFSQLSTDPTVWRQLGNTYRIDVFTGLFLEQANGGTELSVDSLRLLAELGICIGFDIYASEHKALCETKLANQNQAL